MSVCYSDEFGRKIIGNLINDRRFCTSCGELCDSCRDFRPSYAMNLVEIHELPADLPEFVDDPEGYLPEKMLPCDLLLALNLHPDILATVPELVRKSNAKAVIAPVEDPFLAPAGLVGQLKKKLEEMNVEYEFPKPFCSLQKIGQYHIDTFVELGFGKPELHIELDESGKEIALARVVRDAPCGCTWYVARKLSHSDVVDFEETVSKAHHAYPCTASMQHDPELGDTILHGAGYIIRESVSSAIKEAQKED
ncbi:DUF166 family protein [Methanohalophilus sp.]|uniref:DUF166 domain-containing protein n=1 Tax=Methanohalophilus sp. TaxID=1966352 RepID=UPI003443E36E